MPPITTLRMTGRWLPIAQADRTITNVQDFPAAGLTLRNSDRYWVRDEDGRTYEASWSEGKNGRDYWWDWEGESPVDPVEFMPHPLDPRFASPMPAPHMTGALTCQCANTITDPCIVCGKGKTIVTAEWLQKMATKEGDLDPTTGIPSRSPTPAARAEGRE